MVKKFNIFILLFTLLFCVGVLCYTRNDTKVIMVSCGKKIEKCGFDGNGGVWYQTVPLKEDEKFERVVLLDTNDVDILLKRVVFVKNKNCE